MIVEAEISHGEEENDEGIIVANTTATCERCGHETFSWGDSGASVKRCLALLCEECPEGEDNFYKPA